MKLTDVPSPGIISNGFKLRQEALKALNTAQVQASLSGGQSLVGPNLEAFFLACAKLAKGTTPKKKG